MKIKIKILESTVMYWSEVRAKPKSYFHCVYTLFKNEIILDAVVYMSSQCLIFAVIEELEGNKLKLREI